MANATATESCFWYNNSDDIDDSEFLNIDNSLVMSLLEDSEVEDGDNERLRTVIQSLEAEIMSQNSCLGTYDLEGCSDDYRSSDLEKLSSCSTSPDRSLDFEWIDVETDYSCLNDEVAGYFSGQFTDKIDNSMFELGGEVDYLQGFSYSMAMEEDEYCSLWQ
ncbi:hypothetical protein Salat_0233800 [Sesamum alatum]|uniref:Uncharacterized protein n=1 Tax=Sesamum alatum TaxID=300844 RepID=A0AAE2CY79_9LAMI|nr:hypothetical protein Salat_0233800 [Sesamum alatum]